MTVPIGLVPAPPYADIARVLAASHLAKTVLPGPIGDYLHHELVVWCEYGHRFDKRGEALAITADLEARSRALTLGRTRR